MSKRQKHEIRDEILDALERYPMNSSQLAKKIGTGQETVERHLEELRDLHVVRRMKVEVHGIEKTVWEKV